MGFYFLLNKKTPQDINLKALSLGNESKDYVIYFYRVILLNPRVS